MNNKDDLFLLIHSLDKMEKGYFKKFCSIYGRKKNHNYLRLFEYLERQGDYDEKKLLRHFRNERFTRQLPVAKHYLFNLVLRSLELYHRSVEAELGSMLHRIEIIFGKGLYDACGRMLIRAKKIAVRYERHTFLLELLRWEVELARAKSYLGKSEKDMRIIFKDVFSTIKQYHNSEEYSLLVSRLFIREVKKGFARKKGDLQVYQSIVSHPLLKNEKRAVSYPAKFYFFLCFTGYHSIRNEYDKAYLYGRRLVALIESNPHQLAEKPRAYVSAIRNLVTCLGKLKRYGEIPGWIEKMRNVHTRSEALRNNIYYSTTILGLETCLHTGQFEKGLKLIKDFEAGSPGHNRALNKLNETILNYLTCCIYFGAGNFTAANNYLNRILNEPPTGLRSDIQSFARILQLLIHYEMGNDDLLPYLIKSAYRYLSKRERLYVFEDIVLKFIRKKLPRTHSKKDLLSAFGELRKEILRIAEDPFEHTVLEYFDFISWLESKISGRPFAEVVKEKVKTGKQNIHQN